MPITRAQRELLRDLAKQVAEIAAHPRQASQAALWKQHNALRRISISPWTDVRVAAEGLQDRCIFSWKPNPAEMVGRGVFDPDSVRPQIRETMEIARGCVLEIILKDTHTVRSDPQRLTTWVQIASDLAAQYA